MDTDETFISSGVTDQIPPETVWYLWYLTELFIAYSSLKVDYLQVFHLRVEGETQLVVYSQERPAFEMEYRMIPTRTVDAIVFLVHGKGVCSMLLAEEY